jgi:hypothetical protein
MTTAWETLKQHLTKDSRPNTFGESIQIHDAALIFVLLLPFLKDEEHEKLVFNSDESVMNAMAMSKFIKEFKEAGIIQ